MNAIGVQVCQCARCQSGDVHPDRVLHEQMSRLLSRLGEAERRWDAAVEANRRGHGGVHVVAQITGLDEKTIRRGQEEVAGSLADAPIKRQRRVGGGRAPVEKIVHGPWPTLADEDGREYAVGAGRGARLVTFRCREPVKK